MFMRRMCHGIPRGITHGTPAPYMPWCTMVCATARRVLCHSIPHRVCHATSDGLPHGAIWYDGIPHHTPSWYTSWCAMVCGAANPMMHHGMCGIPHGIVYRWITPCTTLGHGVPHNAPLLPMECSMTYTHAYPTPWCTMICAMVYPMA